jgi:hypothetical protein
MFWYPLPKFECLPPGLLPCCLTNHTFLGYHIVHFPFCMHEQTSRAVNYLSLIFMV